MDPGNQSRSDARTAYLDTAIDRPNLHLASEQTVTRIWITKTNTPSTPVPPFGQLRRASGVEVASTSGTRWNISCSSEVILAAGALISPVLLQVSGIGPAELLQSINVSVQIDLPGVGQNFQDHPVVGGFYKCEFDFSLGVEPLLQLGV
jgi:choline dehydrogenase-like flavoprotein